MTYTTSAVVQGLVSRIFNAAGFSVGSTPTTAQVGDMITGISAEIDTHLEANGYTTPLTTPAFAVAYLNQLAAYGVAALVLKSYAPESVGGPNQGPVIPAYSFYNGLYQAGLEQIDNGKVVLGDFSHLASDYLTENPNNYGLGGADGDVGGNWGEGQQPVFSMQKKF